MGCLKITYHQEVRQLGEKHFFLGECLEKGVTAEKNCIDYYPDGTVVVQGQYDSNGNKTGWFERFYEDGKPYSKGQYKNDRQFGQWMYYYEDGSIKEEILFNGDNFIIKESYDKNGNKTVEKGSGIWTYRFIVSIMESYTLTAPVSNGLRIDKWKLNGQNKQIRLVEFYDNGMFKSGKQGTPGFMESYSQTQFTSSIFYPASYEQIESFSHEPYATIEDYPFLDHLPARGKLTSMEGAYLNADDTSIIDLDEVEGAPSPIGGMANFYKYIGKNMKYPDTARRMGIEGRVFVQFIVDTDGSLTEVRTLKGIGAGCNEEAERVVRSSPQWTPGEKNNKPVKVRMILPITFKLGT